MPTPITTGGARIVWGNPLTGKPKTDQNNKIVLDPQTGQPIMQWAFGIAIPKAEFGALWQAMKLEAATVYPQGVPQNFAWKIKDGDGLDDQGKPFNAREGYAGCYVLTVSTESFAPRVVRLNGGAYSDMLEGVKTGDYVRVALNLKAHSGKPNVRGSVPGLYINPVMVEFLGYGEAIQNGPDAMAVFGGQQVAMPQGASAVPLAPQGAMPAPQGMPGQPMQPAYAPMPGAPPAHPMPGQPQHAAPAFAPAAGHPGTAHAAYQGAPGQPTTAYPSNPAPGQHYAPAPAAPAAPPHHAFVHNAAPAFAPAPGQPGAPAAFAPPGQPGYAPMPGQQPGR